MKLSRIADGRLKKDAFLSDIKDYTQDIIREIKTGDGTFRHDNLTNTKCPRCGKRMLAVNGKNARLLVCQDRECGYRETIARLSNARCPNCHKKMEIIKKAKKRPLSAPADTKKNSPLSRSEEKRRRRSIQKDVQNYLKKQKEEPINNAFANALANNKIDT